MGYMVLLQWVVIFLTILVFVWMSKGKSTVEKRMVIAFLSMALLQNVGYLFELMANSRDSAFMALEIEYGGLIFMGYFFCLFFCYYARGRVPQWVTVYVFAFDFFMLLIVWMSSWHELIFADVSYELVEGGYELFFGCGELYIFLILGCELLPAAVALAAIISYISRECSVRQCRQMVLTGIQMYVVYVMAIAFSVRVVPFHYNLAGPLCMIFADLFAVRFWCKEGFNLETVSAEAAFDGMQEGVLILDSAMELMAYNGATKKIFPELEPTMLRHNIKRLHSIPLELFEEYEKKEIVLGNRRYEVHRSKVRDRWDEVRGYVLILNDQTTEHNYIAEIASGKEKLDRAQKDARQALDEVKRADRIKRDFLANVSHEIRTPMNAIVGLAELIIEESRGRKVYDFACDIKNASTNLLAVINDILSLSKLETGQMTLEHETYGTEQLLEETLHLAKLSASSKGLQLKRSISPKLPCRLIGDEMRIRQMITNFLDFGMKYTERGYVKLTVTHRWLDEENVLMIYQFEDTGEGFSPEDVDGLFDQFRRMDERKERNLESIGLGIAITRRFVDLMDGKVEVTSELGKGTIFTVFLPQKVADTRSIGQQPWHKLDVQGLVDQAFIVPDYRVLVVDDNRINLKVACGALSLYKFHIDEAKSGPQAIDMVRQTAYDLIFMDHMMPEMDGIEATAHIRSDCGENGKKPVIIALSANAYNNAKEMFLSNGFQDYIAKPLDKNELHEMLCKWIPKEKRQSVEGTQEAQEMVSQAEIAELFMVGVDVDEILKKHSGGMKAYLDLLELYYMDGEEKYALIEQYARDADYKNYEIQVHGLKSASANIGANEFSELAKSHEYAAKEGNHPFIQEGVTKLLTEYRFLLHEIERALKNHGYLKDERAASEGGQLSEAETRARMKEILEDIENFKPKPAAQKVEALLEENIEKSASDCLKDVRNRLKMYDDDAAENLLRIYLKEDTE